MITTTRKKKRVSPQEIISCRVAMRKNGIESYKVITKLAKITGYGLIAYGVLTIYAPTGSQLAILGGCALLGIPYKVVIREAKHWGKKALFVARVLLSPARLRYELKTWRLRL